MTSLKKKQVLTPRQELVLGLVSSFTQHRAQWESASAASLAHLNQLINASLLIRQVERSYLASESNQDEGEDEECSASREVRLSEQIESSMSMLSRVMEQLNELLISFQAVVASFQSALAAELASCLSTGSDDDVADAADVDDKDQSHTSHCSLKPLFHTLTLEHYAGYAERLLAMYRKELVMKTNIYQSVTSEHLLLPRDTLDIYMGSWMMEPFVDANLWSEFERRHQAELTRSAS